jgi:hypothetical protein
LKRNVPFARKAIFGPFGLQVVRENFHRRDVRAIGGEDSRAVLKEPDIVRLRECINRAAAAWKVQEPSPFKEALANVSAKRGPSTFLLFGLINQIGGTMKEHYGLP